MRQLDLFQGGLHLVIGKPWAAGARRASAGPFCPGSRRRGTSQPADAPRRRVVEVIVLEFLGSGGRREQQTRDSNGRRGRHHRRRARSSTLLQELILFSSRGSFLSGPSRQVSAVAAADVMSAGQGCKLRRRYYGRRSPAFRARGQDRNVNQARSPGTGVDILPFASRDGLLADWDVALSSDQRIEGTLLQESVKLAALAPAESLMRLRMPAARRDLRRIAELSLKQPFNHEILGKSEF